MIRHLLTAVLLAALWQLWSGHTEPLIVSFGVGSVLLVVWLRARMDVVDGSRGPYVLGLRWIPYLPWLLWEVVKSNVVVARAILSPGPNVQPQLVRVQGSQKTELGQVIYANSITLTPGTVTCDVRDGSFLVHALLDETAEGLREGSMDRRCAELEGI